MTATTWTTKSAHSTGPTIGRYSTLQLSASLMSMTTPQIFRWSTPTARRPRRRLRLIARRPAGGRGGRGRDDLRRQRHHEQPRDRGALQRRRGQTNAAHGVLDLNGATPTPTATPTRTVTPAATRTPTRTPTVTPAGRRQRSRQRQPGRRRRQRRQPGRSRQQRPGRRPGRLR